MNCCRTYKMLKYGVAMIVALLMLDRTTNAFSIHLGAKLFRHRVSVSQHKKFSAGAIHRQLSALQMSADDVKSSDWDFIDSIYLITTDLGGDRFESTKEELQRINLWDRVTVKTFKADNEDRVRGCYTSHMAVLKEVQNKYKRKPDFTVLVLEDNLEVTGGMDPAVLQNTAAFLKEQPSWDIFHLAYMMYVPGLNFERQSKNQNVVRMIAGSEASVGTSSYLISKSGVKTLLAKDKQQGFVEAIPTVMAELFPSSRYAAYPMVFHRAGKIGSLVNPQLDDFRKFMFNPLLYRSWERLMVTTGLQNNQLFPGLVITLLAVILSTLYSLVTGALSTVPSGEELQDAATTTTAVAAAATTGSGGLGGGAAVQLLVAMFPLAIAVWGASLFRPGNQGAGFAVSTRQRSAQRQQTNGSGSYKEV